MGISKILKIWQILGKILVKTIKKNIIRCNKKRGQNMNSKWKYGFNKINIKGIKNFIISIKKRVEIEYEL